MINKEYEALERNLKNLEVKKIEQNEKENHIVVITKKLKLKANELAKKEEYLRQKNLKIEEVNEYW
jgi:hypothetical protein